MRLLRPTGFAGGGALAVIVASSTAFAYFTATGAGQASAEVAWLPAPSISSAVPAVGGTVALSWGAVTAPDAGAVTYTLSRDEGEPAGSCPGKSSPSSVTSCTDGALEPGVHTYTVTARWRSWTAVSAPVTAKVTIGAPTHLALGAASTTPAAGTADNLTIAAKDVSGNTVTTYAGSHGLVFSGADPSPGGNAPTVSNSSGSAKAFGSETAMSFSAGVASVSGSRNGVMKLYAAEAADVSVSDGSIASAPGLEVTVAPGTASKLSLAVDSTTPVAGAADDLTITALDTYGNVATSYGSSHNLTFSGASASPSGESPTVTNNGGVTKAFGSATTITFDSGVATVAATGNGRMRLYKAGSANLKASDGSISSTATAVTVSPAPAAELSLAAASTTPTAGASDNLTVTALDPYDNTATGYAASHGLVFSGAGTSPGGSAPTVVNSAGATIAFGAETAIGFSAGVAKVASSKNGVMKLYSAETATISVSDGAISDPEGVVATVKPSSAAKLAFNQLSVGAGTIGSPCLFTCAIAGLGNDNTVTASVAVTDSVGNTVSDLGKGHAAKVSSSGGTISNGALPFPSSGAAVSTGQFTYKSKSSGSFTDTIAAATSEGTTYAGATATASG